MSSIPAIVVTHTPISETIGKPPTQQATEAIPQPHPITNSSSVTISSSGKTYSIYEQQNAASRAGLNQSISNAYSDPQWGAALAYGLAHDHSMTGVAVGGLLVPNAVAPAVYVSGAPVTVASQAYFEKQNALYQNQVLELYNTGKAKGAAPGQIISDIFALQAKQPDAFRAMMMWTPAFGPTSIQDATNIPGTPPQYLYGDGQVAKS